MQEESALEKAARYITAKAEELEIAAEDSSKFTNVSVVTQHQGKTITLVVQFCSPKGSIKLSMRVWEPNSLIVHFFYNSTYEELMDRIFEELKRFALTASLEDLVEVRKILLLEGN